MDTFCDSLTTEMYVIVCCYKVMVKMVGIIIFVTEFAVKEILNAK